MKTVFIAQSVVTLGLVVLFGLSPASARVTTSQVICKRAPTPSDGAKTYDVLRRMVSESRAVGKVVGVVISNVSSDVSSSETRSRLREDSIAMVRLIEELGLHDAESSIEFVEALPSGHGCRDAVLAVNVEFVYEHR